MLEWPFIILHMVNKVMLFAEGKYVMMGLGKKWVYWMKS